MRILVVEDEQNIADSLKKGLELEGYNVQISYDGESALDLILTESYDLVILDIMLPKLDGIEIVKQMRTENILIPVIMLTARGELSDKVEGFRNGADDYLVKPFQFDELVARVRALLKRSYNIITDKQKCFDITIDFNNFEVYKNNKKIDLTKKEFELLEYLFRNKGSVVTKQQLIDHVWDYDADILPNTVEVYIRYLRKKLDKEGKIIQTKRGFGYIISCNDNV